METDVLVILMMAFGLFAILMFILFYIYAKKHYNEKHITDDIIMDDNAYEEENPIDNTQDVEEIKPINEQKENNDLELDFIPKKKKG